MPHSNEGLDEEKQDISFSELSDEYLGALVLSGDYLSNGF